MSPSKDTILISITIVLPALEIGKNEIKQFAVFEVCLLSLIIWFGRFCHVITQKQATHHIWPMGLTFPTLGLAFYPILPLVLILHIF